MKTIVKSLAIAAALTLTAGAAMATEQALKDCCKENCDRPDCCDDMKKPDAKPGGEQQQPNPDHKH